jgi:adenylate cyclase
LKSTKKDLISYLSVTKVGIFMILVSFGLFFTNFPIIQAISNKAFDLNFKMRGPIDTEKDVVIIAIDQKSQEELGRWPWTRSVIVKLVDRLATFNPKVIGLDIVFSYPEKRPDLDLARKILPKLKTKDRVSKEILEIVKDAEEFADVDTRLAKSFKNAGNTVPGYFFFTTHEEIEPLNLDNMADYKNIRKSRYRKIKYPAQGKKDFILKEGVGVKPNIKPLTDAAEYTGYFNIFPDDDGVIRRLVNVVKFNKKYFPSAVIQMLRVFYDDKDAELRFEEYGVTGIKVGPRIIPTDEYGRTIINYYGPQDMFKKISIADILNGTIPNEELIKMLEGKIAIIGATAKGIYDIRHTPFESMPGVEVEANFIQNVIDDKMLSKAGWFFFFDALSMLFLGVFIIFFMNRFKLLGGGLISITLISAYIYFQRYMFIDQRIQLDVIYPILSIVFVYGGTAFYKYYVESKEKQFIQGAFGQYLSPAVITQIINDPSKLSLGGVRKEMSVMFSDIAGFSSISEKLEPEELVQLLNEYLTEMSDIIMAQHGTVDKYEGDAIIAFFGAPGDDPDHALHCTMAVLEMQLKLEEMRKVWAGQGKDLLRMRIGVNTGPMVVGNMGSKNKMDYTIMGDTVNLASRLEGANKGYGTETMVTKKTAEICRDNFEFRELDSIRVVGKNEVTTVFELLCAKGKLLPEQVKLLDAHNRGLSHYKARDWHKAIEAFDESLSINSDDGPAKTYIERCMEYLRFQPGSDWDGVYTLTSK